MSPLWERERWGEGRTFEQFARGLSDLEQIQKVLCVFPAVEPKKYPAAPFSVSWENSKLALVVPSSSSVQPIGYPFRVRRGVNRFAGSTLAWYLKARGFDARSALHWVFPPTSSVRAVSKLMYGAGLVVHVVDDFSKMGGAIKYGAESVIESDYLRLVSAADLVITGSQANYERFVGVSKRCVRIPNGVDESFLGIPKGPRIRCAGDRPRILYVGFISERTDLALIEDLARMRPDYDFLLAGSLFDIPLSSISTLIARPNVSWLGHVPYRELPRLMQNADVCIIPHRDMPLTRSMDPLKLYQYLASGSPVVATPVAGVLDFADYITISDGAVDFANSIDRALNEDTAQFSERRISVALKNTWRMRMEEVMGHLRGAFS